MANINPVIEESWKRVLWDEFNAPYFAQLKDFLVNHLPKLYVKLRVLKHRKRAKDTE